MSTIYEPTAYGERTARTGERLLAAEDAATASREASEDRMQHIPHRYTEGPVAGFCGRCRVNEKSHP